MSNYIKVLFITSGDRKKASSRVRAFWIGEELEKNGYKCDFGTPKSRLAVLSYSKQIFGYDVLIFQKTFGRYHDWLLKLAQMLGKKIYIDIDDAPSPAMAPHTMRRVASMMGRSSGVFAGSNNLLHFSSQYNANSLRVPSCIKLENYPIKKPRRVSDRQPICLGWIGNANYYAEDLITILSEPLRRLTESYSIKITKIVGACENLDLRKNFEAIPNLEYEQIDSIDWSSPSAVIKEIHSFDIGLYPLIENDFNKYKCGFKALEYMACGLPVMSSNVAVNAEIVRHGEMGYLANNSAEWVEYLKALIESDELRQNFGFAGRHLVENSYSTCTAANLIMMSLSNAPV